VASVSLAVAWLSTAGLGVSACYESDASELRNAGDQNAQAGVGLGPNESPGVFVIVKTKPGSSNCPTEEVEELELRAVGSFAGTGYTAYFFNQPTSVPTTSDPTPREPVAPDEAIVIRNILQATASNTIATNKQPKTLRIEAAIVGLRQVIKNNRDKNEAIAELNRWVESSDVDLETPSSPKEGPLAPSVFAYFTIQYLRQLDEKYSDITAACGQKECNQEVKLKNSIRFFCDQLATHADLIPVDGASCSNFFATFDRGRQYAAYEKQAVPECFAIAGRPLNHRLVRCACTDTNATGNKPAPFWSCQ